MQKIISNIGARRAIGITLLAIAHSVITGIVIFASVGIGMARVDYNPHLLPSLDEQLLNFAMVILVMPVYPVVQEMGWGGGMVMGAAYLLNSLLWGMALYLLGALLTRRRLPKNAMW